MSAINCATCGHSWTEEWPRKQMAIRCGHEGSGACMGYVTQIYPEGKRVLAEVADTPIWCGERKREEEHGAVLKDRGGDLAVGAGDRVVHRP